MHIGKLIKQELTNQGRDIVWFAKQMDCSRAGAYKMFSQSSIEADRLLLISNLLNVDFFKFYSNELKQEKLELTTNDE